MLAIFLKTLPFFALIATGYLAGRTRFFTPHDEGWGRTPLLGASA